MSSSSISESSVSSIEVNMSLVESPDVEEEFDVQQSRQQAAVAVRPASATDVASLAPSSLLSLGERRGCSHLPRQAASTRRSVERGSDGHSNSSAMSAVLAPFEAGMAPESVRLALHEAEAMTRELEDVLEDVQMMSVENAILMDTLVVVGVDMASL